MSTTEGGQAPGWEVWFLLAVLAIGGAAMLLLLPFGVVGFNSFDSAAPISPDVSQAPVPEPGRAAVGLIGALAFGAAATWIIRTTDWANDLNQTEQIMQEDDRAQS